MVCLVPLASSSRQPTAVLSVTVTEAASFAETATSALDPGPAPPVTRSCAAGLPDGVLTRTSDPVTPRSATPIVSFGVPVSTFRVAPEPAPASEPAPGRSVMDRLTVCGPDGAGEDDGETLRATIAPQPASTTAAHSPWMTSDRVTFTH